MIPEKGNQTATFFLGVRKLKTGANEMGNAREN